MKMLKGTLAAVVLLALLALPFISFKAAAQNAVPAFPPAGAQVFPNGVMNGCTVEGTLSSGVLTIQNDCINGYSNKECLAAAQGNSATNYAGIGIKCLATTTTTATTTATSTATTTAYGGTTIASATATSTATTAAHGAMALTASTLNASPVVDAWGVR